MGTPLQHAASLPEGLLAVRVFSVLHVEDTADEEWPLRIAEAPGYYFSLGAAYDAVDRIGWPDLRVTSSWRFLNLSDELDRAELADLAHAEAAV